MQDQTALIDAQIRNYQGNDLIGYTSSGGTWYGLSRLQQMAQTPREGVNPQSASKSTPSGASGVFGSQVSMTATPSGGDSDTLMSSASPEKQTKSFKTPSGQNLRKEGGKDQGKK